MCYILVNDWRMTRMNAHLNNRLYIALLVLLSLRVTGKLKLMSCCAAS